MKKLPKSIIYSGLDAFSSKFLKNTRPLNSINVAAQLREELERVAELLIFSPRVTFKIYGENVVLPLLISAFGSKTVEKLLEEKSIEFLLNRGHILHDTEYLDGLYPLSAGNSTNPEHSDPYASNDRGLLLWGNNLSLSEDYAYRLIDLATEQTLLTGEKLPHEALNKAKEAHKDGRLEKFGLPASLEFIGERDMEKVKTFCSIATDVFITAMAAENEYDLKLEKKPWDYILAVSAKLQKADGIVRTAETLLNYERLPSIPYLLRKEKITLADIIKIRDRDETKVFRDWFWSQENPSDAKAVSKEYLGKVIGRKKTKNRKFYRAMRVSGISLIGSLAGTAVAGPAGYAAGTAVGVGVSLIDELLLDRLFREKNPRRFATDVISPIDIKNQ